MHTPGPVVALVSILAGLLLTACGGGNSNDDGGLIASPSAAFSLFDPTGVSNTSAGSTPIIPFPFDGLFAGAATPTLNIPLPDPLNPANPANALVMSANLQDGFSTSASIFTDFAGFVDLATVPQGLLLINGATGQPLVYGTDFTVQSSTAIAADGVPINLERTRLLIEPLKPLSPATTYIVALTPAILSRDHLPIVASDYFVTVRSAIPVAEQTSSFAAVLTPTQRATLEAVRSQLIRPLVQVLTAPPALGGAGLAEAQIVLAWSFTTESTSKTLQSVAANASAGFIQIAPTGLNTLAVGGFGLADIAAGITTVPYYLNDAGAPSDPHSTAPLSGYWHADATQPDVAAVFAPTALSAAPLPCGAFAPGNGFGLQASASTTGCFPVVDAATAITETIPVLVTIPNANSGQLKPAAGWPVVMFQHGITRNRGDLLAVADSLAQAGFVAIAIDLPLHGVSPPDPLLPLPTDPLYRNALFAGSPAAGLQTGERTFDLDLQNNATSAPGPDGRADASGSFFINLPSLVTSRDNIRQAVADLLTLEKTLATLDVDGDGLPDIDTARVHFFGHSLGAIVGTTFLGVSTSGTSAALANPGGGIGKLLDGSASFGPAIAAGLLANGLVEGSDDYETFIRFAQTLIDPADPINYAVAARANHPILMLEVIGDSVVPNTVHSNCIARAGGIDCTPTAANDRVLLDGFLSGTDPLYRTMGLTPLGPLTVPIAAQAPLFGPNLGVLSQFAQGNHGSILDPTGDAVTAAVTCEMQRQVASFLASDGAALPVGGSCP